MSTRTRRTLALTAAVAGSAVLVIGPPAGASGTPAPGGGPTAYPPPVAEGEGVVATVDGTVADVLGIVADVVPRVATLDGGLQTEGEADFTLASDVYFAFGSADLLPQATADLQALATRAQEAAVEALVVVGHTDAVGDDASNQALSEARAASVVAALGPLLPGVTLTAEGRGETEPVAEETRDGADFPEGRALNRRVTVAPPA